MLHFKFTFPVCMEGYGERACGYEWPRVGALRALLHYCSAVTLTHHALLALLSSFLLPLLLSTPSFFYLISEYIFLTILWRSFSFQWYLNWISFRFSSPQLSVQKWCEYVFCSPWFVFSIFCIFHFLILIQSLFPVLLLILFRPALPFPVTLTKGSRSRSGQRSRPGHLDQRQGLWLAVARVTFPSPTRPLCRTGARCDETWQWRLLVSGRRGWRQHRGHIYPRGVHL